MVKGWDLDGWREFCATAERAEHIGNAWYESAGSFAGRAFRQAMYAAGEALTVRFGFVPTAALVFLAQNASATCRGCDARVRERELSNALGAPLCRACVADVAATIDASADERREAVIEAQTDEVEPCAAVAA